MAHTQRHKNPPAADSLKHKVLLCSIRSWQNPGFLLEFCINRQVDEEEKAEFSFTSYWFGEKLR